jgi:hypothetical protein
MCNEAKVTAQSGCMYKTLNHYRGKCGTWKNLYIMWTRQRFSELISGIKFTAIISDLMIQQLVKKTP